MKVKLRRKRQKTFVAFYIGLLMDKKNESMSLFLAFYPIDIEIVILFNPDYYEKSIYTD